MTREEQIVDAGKLHASDNKFCDLAMSQHRVMSAYEMGFIDGAVWADSHPNWISVADDLPPIQDKGTYSDLVLVCGTKGEIDTAKYSYMSSRWQCSAVLLTVTHWMPLPAPPVKTDEQ